MNERFKTIHVFSVGMLCGVIITAAVAFGLAIPANSDHWRMEIWKRGGASSISDKNGHLNWMWTVEPISDIRREKPHLVPTSQTNIRIEHL